MSYGYSIDLRKRVLSFIEEGHGGITKASRVFSIGKSAIYSWINKKKTTGSIDITKRIKKPRKFKKHDLINYINKHPDAYLHEIAKNFNMSISGVCRALKRLNITRKKSLLLIRKKIQKNAENI
jgi:putative transposase